MRFPVILLNTNVSKLLLTINKIIKHCYKPNQYKKKNETMYKKSINEKEEYKKINIKIDDEVK